MSTRDAETQVGEATDATEVKRRAVVGVVVDALRIGGIRAVGLVGTIVVARLLTPHDLGMVAIGTTVLTFSAFIDDGGVGPALIRRVAPPAKAELEGVFALQLLIDLLIVLIVGLAMLPLGKIGTVTTLIVLSLPLTAFRLPAYIIYERMLSYRTIAIAEIAETFVYYIWAITTISLGWGVWGLASAFVVREFAGSLLILILLPAGRVLPKPQWRAVKGLLRFGMQVQAVGILAIIRDLGVNVLVGAFGGVAVLGLWSVAWKIIQLPLSLLQSLWRVSFPGMARLIAAKEDVGQTIERLIPLVAIGTGLLVVPLSASAAAWVHMLIGARWVGAASPIPTACLAMTFGVPISVALNGYLWATGNGSVPMRATAAGIPVTLAIVAALLPIIGLTAAGIAYTANAVVECVFFVVAARRTTSFKIGWRLVSPVLLAVAAGGAGWLVERSVGPNLVGAVSSAGVAAGIYILGLVLIQRADVLDIYRLVTRGLRGVLGRTPAVA
jgi:O-antigen/teichoic acid export membrane protein